MMQKLPRVFISYQRSDSAFAEELRRYLALQGYGVWMDNYDIPKTDKWDDQIDVGLRNSNIVVGVMTPASVRSENVKNEWGWADQYGRHLILLRLQPCEVPHRYVRHNYIDCVGRELATVLQELVIAINSTLSSSDEGIEPDRDPPEEGPIDERDLRLLPIHTYRPGFTPTSIFFLETKQQFVMTDGDRFVIYGHDSVSENAAKHLPEIRWKTIGPVLWDGCLVCADWKGALHLFGCDEEVKAQVLAEAKPADLPVHQIAVAADGNLWVVCWDGSLSAFGQDGQHLFPADKMVFLELPVHLIPCDDGNIAVVDQRQMLSVVDPGGNLIWQWHADGVVDEIWSCTGSVTSDTEQGFLLILDGTRIVKIFQGNGQKRQLDLPARVCCYAHVNNGRAESSTAIALANRQLLWLSWSPFRFMNRNPIELEFDVSRLAAAHDPSQPNVQIAFALDPAGRLSVVKNHEVTTFETAKNQELALDPSGRFLFLLQRDRVVMHRNPEFQSGSCIVSMVGAPEGELLVAVYRPVDITVRNVSRVPISRLRARLIGKDRIMPSKEYVASGLFKPDDIIPLHFSVQAIAEGTLQLSLEITMQDEAGPPETHMELEIEIEAKNREDNI